MFLELLATSNSGGMDEDSHEEQFMTIMKDGRIENDEYLPKRGRGRPRGLKNVLNRKSYGLEPLNNQLSEQLTAIKKEYSDDYIKVISVQIF